MVFLFPVALIIPDVWLSYLSKKTLEQQQKVDSMVIYAGATATSLVLITIRVFLFFTVSLRSSQRLHDRMVEALMHAQLSFFDTNPAGRILNHFSRDIWSIDEELPQNFILCIQNILLVISATLLPAISNPWLLFIFFPTTAAFIVLGRYYLKTSRELKSFLSFFRDHGWTGHLKFLYRSDKALIVGFQNNTVKQDLKPVSSQFQRWNIYCSC